MAACRHSHACSRTHPACSAGCEEGRAEADEARQASEVDLGCAGGSHRGKPAKGMHLGSERDMVVVGVRRGSGIPGMSGGVWPKPRRKPPARGAASCGTVRLM